MSLIYPEEAWRRFGPAPIAVHDAKGRRLWHVCACDPVTGEVIQNIQAGSLVAPSLIARYVGLLAELRYPLDKLLRRRFHISVGSILQRHFFAPAPLTISRIEPGAP